MITFTDFIKSRNLNVSQFEDMAYIDLLSYCKARSIQAPSLADFLVLKKPSIFEISEPTPTAVETLEPVFVHEVVSSTISITPIDIDKIQKCRKTTIQDYCTQRGIEFTEEHTKKELINMLKQFES